MSDSSRLDIRALRVFDAVASSGSISAAASALGVTQSAVSQAVGQIEEILGTKVLDRSRRPVLLTPAGIALRRHAQTVVDEMERLLAVVREADLTGRPEIRIGMIDSYAATVGPAVVKHTIAQGNQAVLRAGFADSLSLALLQRQLDLIVTSDPMDDMDNLVRRPLFVEPSLLVVHAARREQYRSADLQTLARELPFVRFSKRSHYGAVTERYLRRCGVSADRHLEIDAADVLLAMVAADLGWSICPALALLQGRAHLQDIAAIPVADPPLVRTIFQVSRAGEYEDTAEFLYQTSRRVLEKGVFAEIRARLPDVGAKLHLS